LKKNIRIVIGLFIGIVSLSGVVGFAAVNKGIKANEQVTKVTQIFEKEEIKDEKRLELYKKIHEMANTKIKAEDGLIWGEDEPTVEKIDVIIEEISRTNYEDKDKLISILNRWKNGDFSNCVEEHNYVWKKLDGQVGKASSLRENSK